MRKAEAAFVMLCACGLVDPPAPPARVIGPVPDVPGAAVPDPGRHDWTPEPPFLGFVLAWDEEFDGTVLDEGVWTIDERPALDAVNARDSVVLKDGILTLVTFTAAGVHHAGHVHTAGKVEILYGYFEARVRFLDSAGQWCSFFIYPDAIDGAAAGDPGTAGVEIDVFEHRDADANGYDVRDMVQVGVNSDLSGNRKRDNQLVAHPLGEPLSHEWHTYASLWTESDITFYVDDIPVWRTSRAVSHRSEPVYLTCEVKDGSWAGYVPPTGYGSLESSTTGMEIDWVRVWQAEP